MIRVAADHRRYLKRPREGTERARILDALRDGPKTVIELLDAGCCPNGKRPSDRRSHARAALAVMERKRLVEPAEQIGNEFRWRLRVEVHEPA